MPAQGGSCTSSANDTAILHVRNTEFAFLEVEEGMYTVCAVHESFIVDREAGLDDRDVHLLPFTTSKQVGKYRGLDRNHQVLANAW